MFSEPPFNLKMNVPWTGYMFISGQETYGFVPRTNGKPKTHVSTTSKETKVLAGYVLQYEYLS
jgi:hypothetical protein